LGRETFKKARVHREPKKKKVFNLYSRGAEDFSPWDDAWQDAMSEKVMRSRMQCPKK